MRSQQGFTLIELIMVIAILAALAVVAIPRYINLSDQAEQAAVDGVAGSLGAASAINFAAWVAGSTDSVAIDDCEDIEGLLQGGALPTGYSIAAQAITAAAETADCDLTGPTNATATFVGHYAETN